jgi:aminopeptidase N
VPLRLWVYPGQVEARRLEVKEVATRASLPAPRLVQAVDLDPDYRLWRRVPQDHFPPILREVFVAPRTGLLVPEADANLAEAASALAERVLDARPEPLRESGLGLPGSAPVLIIGRAEPVDALLARLGLPPRPAQLAAAGSAWVWAARDGTGRPYVVIAARDGEALDALQRALPHHGRQSWLVFDAAQAVAKGIWPPRPERR